MSSRRVISALPPGPEPPARSGELLLGPVGHAAALGLVHVLAGHRVAVGPGVVPERPQLGGHEQVHVLPVRWTLERKVPPV